MANPDPKNLELLNYLKYHCTPEDLQQVLDEMMDAMGDDLEGILALTEMVESLRTPAKIKDNLDRFMEPVDIKTFMYDPYFLGLHEFDEETGKWLMSEIDWSEFDAVLDGRGPANTERLKRRREAHENGAWVREAAAAYAAKQSAKDRIAA